MEKRNKPNLLIFVPDEMRGEVITNPQIRMPNMRGIREDGGVIFTQNFSANPVCGPSRVCTFTGQYPHNGGHRSLYQFLRKGDENLFRILKENGYDVIWAGRNDLFHKEAIKSSISKRIGGNTTNRIVKTLIKEGIRKYGLFRMLRIIRKARKSKNMKSMLHIPEIANLAENIIGKRPFDMDSKWYNTFYFGELENVAQEMFEDDEIISHTLGYLDEYASKTKHRKPFCLYVAISLPHPPYHIEEPYFSMYDRSKLTPPYPLNLDLNDRAKKPAYATILHNKYGLDKLSDDDNREILATYYGMCTKVDGFFGRIVQKLKDLDLYDNTMVTSFADHGDYAASYGLTEKWPSGMEDALLNVPLLVKLPNETASLSQTASLTQTIDIFPTILEVAGIEHPYTHFGKSLLPVVRGGTETHRDAVYAEGGYDPREPQAFEDVGQSPDDPGFGIYFHKTNTQRVQPETVCRTTMCRTEKWKLTLRTHPNAVEELYDLEKDPAEIHNLYSDPTYSKIVLELKEKILRWYLETSDNPHYYHKRDQ